MTDIRKTKVFISWSKEPARAIAKALYDFLPELVSAVDPFMSAERIEPGARSMAEIEAKLVDSHFGISIVTPENQEESWLQFEAGALSREVKGRDDQRGEVVPVLAGFSSLSALTGPLAQFQAVMLDRAGLERVVKKLASLAGEDRDVTVRRFGRAWPELEERLDAALRSAPSQEPQARRRDDREIWEEILLTVRRMDERAANRSLLDEYERRRAQQARARGSLPSWSELEGFVREARSKPWAAQLDEKRLFALIMGWRATAVATLAGETPTLDEYAEKVLRHPGFSDTLPWEQQDSPHRETESEAT